MKRQYYYLVTLLPTLAFDRKPPFSSADFMDICKKHLDGRHFIKLKKISDPQNGSESIVDFFDEWNIWDRGLKNELAAMRASIISIRDKGLKHPLPQIATSENSLKLYKAVTSKNPLEAEKAMEKIRWDQLEKMEFGHYFDFDKIIIYALKLKIIERLGSFDRAKGGKILGDLIDSICSNYPLQMTDNHSF